MENLAIAPITNDKVKKTDIWKPRYSQIEIDPELNIRVDYGDIYELADNIKENGIKVALRGYRKGDKFVPVDGHRRTAACKILFERDGLDVEMPFIIETKGTNAEQRIIDMFITNEGKSLNPLEMAEGIKRLIAYGWEMKEIATKLSKSEGYIRKLHTLNSAPKKFTNLIIKGVISSTFAVNLLANKEVDTFMENFEAGNFSGEHKSIPLASEINEEGVKQDNSITSGGETMEFFEHDKEKETKAPVKKITNRDVANINSLKEFKKLAKSIDVSNFSDEQTMIFELLTKVANNDLSGENFIELFSAA